MHNILPTNHVSVESLSQQVLQVASVTIPLHHTYSERQPDPQLLPWRESDNASCLHQVAPGSTDLFAANSARFDV